MKLSSYLYFFGSLAFSHLFVVVCFAQESNECRMCGAGTIGPLQQEQGCSYLTQTASSLSGADDPNCLILQRSAEWVCDCRFPAPVTTPPVAPTLSPVQDNRDLPVPFPATGIITSTSRPTLPPSTRAPIAPPTNSPVAQTPCDIQVAISCKGCIPCAEFCENKEEATIFYSITNGNSGATLQRVTASAPGDFGGTGQQLISSDQTLSKLEMVVFQQETVSLKGRKGEHFQFQLSASGVGSPGGAACNDWTTFSFTVGRKIPNYHA